MFSASDLKKGLKILLDGDPCVITQFEFTKPGKGQSIYRGRVKNMITGNQFDKSWRSGDKIEKADLMNRNYSFSYIDGENYVFLDNETYEQADIPAEVLGDARYFLNAEMIVDILFFGDRALAVELPNFVEKAVIRTEPGARGDTTTNVLKPATVEGGFELGVPIFINEGDVVKIDTRSGEYSARVNS
jgi:elongation factor P